jgi:hypothetical protein
MFSPIDVIKLVVVFAIGLVAFSADILKNKAKSANIFKFIFHTFSFTVLQSE